MRVNINCLFLLAKIKEGALYLNLGMENKRIAVRAVKCFSSKSQIEHQQYTIISIMLSTTMLTLYLHHYINDIQKQDMLETYLLILCYVSAHNISKTAKQLILSIN